MIKEKNFNSAVTKKIVPSSIFTVSTQEIAAE